MMTKREMLDALRAAQDALYAVYEGLGAATEPQDMGAYRVALLSIMRGKVGPVAYQLQNEIEQEELEYDA